MERPLLIFPSVGISEKEPGSGYPPTYRPVFPSKERQTERLTPMFARLERAFEQRRLMFQDSMTGAMAEQALVFETIDSIDQFKNAVERLEEFEWLGEWEPSDEISPDDDFYMEKEGEKSDKNLGYRLFLIMSDQHAIQQMLSLWDMHKKGEKLEHGLGRWNALFSQLRDVRPWSIHDRFYNTGFEEELRTLVSFGKKMIRFEVELWFRSSESSRNSVSNKIRELIESHNGTVHSECVIPEISYHAILAETSIGLFRNLKDNTDVQLLKSDHIFYFRPVGQTIIDVPEGDLETVEQPKEMSHPENSQPLVALLDGMPLANHDLLKGRLTLDDPDSFQGSYLAGERRHGTAMASLIIHGELDDHLPPINRPLYVRPILKPDKRDWLNRPPAEKIPEDVLSIDLIHRAIKRIFDDASGKDTVNSIKIINLSIGDITRPFDYSLSPMARLLDWLSFKYNVLFIVSAGNYGENIKLDIENVSELTAEELSDEIMKDIYNNASNRRILAPSESMNALTVGALHDDSSTIQNLGFRKDVIQHSPILSPISRLGLGYRRSIKPDIVMKGGKLLYSEDPTRESHFTPSNFTTAPGQKSAFPGQQGETSQVAYTRGTSNASALTSRLAHELCEMLITMSQTQPDGDKISSDLYAVLIKALIVHGASWGDIRETVTSALNINYSRAREHVLPRLFGYGLIDHHRLFECTEQRATLFGSNKLKKDEAHTYIVPLPPSLESKREWRRLTITLAWFTPINNKSKKYRQAQLWFDPPHEVLNLKRTEGDWLAVKRGTVQHEILEGEQAVPYIQGNNLVVKVNCKEDAGGLNDEVPYALVVSLEVAEGVDIRVYQEIRDAIRPRVHIQQQLLF